MDTSAIGHSAKAPAISIERIEKWFGTRDKPVHALAPTDLNVPEGELLVLLGPSGCGKTTLLRMIGGLLEPTSGALRIEGQSLWNDGAREGAALGELGMVFQEANLFPWLSIEDNIALPLELKGVSRAQRIARAHELMNLVGISGFEKRWPRELSGGMRQRAAIARALSYDPKILLMDEPFGALDAMTRAVLQGELSRIWAETKKTVLFITHDIEEACALATRIGVMRRGPGGTLKAIVPVDLPFPRERTSDAFMRVFRDVHGLIHDEIHGAH